MLNTSSSLFLDWLVLRPVAEKVFDLTPRYDLIFRGLNGEDGLGPDLASAFEHTLPAAIAACIVTITTRLLLGNLARRFVWACRLDAYLPFLRMKNDWYYPLRGRVSLPKRILTRIPIADILTSHEHEGTRLL